jgi:hypothetical protein
MQLEVDGQRTVEHQVNPALSSPPTSYPIRDAETSR